MVGFITIKCRLVLYDENIEDASIRDISSIDLGETNLLINVFRIVCVQENAHIGGTIITTSTGEQILSTSTYYEITQKIIAAQTLQTFQ